MEPKRSAEGYECHLAVLWSKRQLFEVRRGGGPLHGRRTPTRFLGLPKGAIIVLRRQLALCECPSANGRESSARVGCPSASGRESSARVRTSQSSDRRRSVPTSERCRRRPPAHV